MVNRDTVVKRLKRRQQVLLFSDDLLIYVLYIRMNFKITFIKQPDELQ